MKNILNTLITDRTMADADYAMSLDKKGWARMTAKERAAYSGGLKGAYGAVDMNRVVGAMEYLESLMNRTGVSSGYEPVTINHVGSGGKTWTDTVWIDYDKPSPARWAAHLENVRQFWAYVRKIKANILPRYDPDGKYFIGLDETFTAGDICTVTESNGLLRIIIDIACDPAYITAQGMGWEVAQTEDGWQATYFYPNWMFSDIQNALSALKFSCTAEDGVFEVSFTFRAELRYGAERTLGTCTTRWSSHITWGGAFVLYEPHWGTTKKLTWYQFERGELTHEPYTLTDDAFYLTADGKSFLSMR